MTSRAFENPRRNAFNLGNHSLLLTSTQANWRRVLLYLQNSKDHQIMIRIIDEKSAKAPARPS